MHQDRNENNLLPGANPDAGPAFYEIQVRGLLDPGRSQWFEGMRLTYIEDGDSGLPCTLIAGAVADQPALHGLLEKIRDLNLTLVSVRRFADGESPFCEAGATH